MFRKTFYCLAIFGEAPEYDLKESARHKSVECSIVYRKAAQVLYQQHTNSPHPSNNVAKWKSIKVDGSDGNTLVLLALGGCKIVEFAELGDYFVRRLLYVSEGSPLATDPRFLLDKAISYVGADCPREKFRKFRATLHPDQSTDLQRIVDAMLCQRVKALLENGNLAVATAGLVIGVTEADDPQETPSPPKKRARVEEAANDLPERKQLGALKTSTEKIETMTKLLADKERSSTRLTSGAKTFASRDLTPTMNCLKNHFGGDVTRFAEKYPVFSHATFRHQYCNGHGEVCAPKPK